MILFSVHYGCTKRHMAIDNHFLNIAIIFLNDVTGSTLNWCKTHPRSHKYWNIQFTFTLPQLTRDLFRHLHPAKKAKEATITLFENQMSLNHAKNTKTVKYIQKSTPMISKN